MKKRPLLEYSVVMYRTDTFLGVTVRRNTIHVYPKAVITAKNPREYLRHRRRRHSNVAASKVVYSKTKRWFFHMCKYNVDSSVTPQN